MLLIYGAAAGMLVVVVVGNMIGGSGIGWTNVTTTIAGTAGLGPARQGLAAGLLTTAQQIGAAVGVSLASVVATIMPQQPGVGGRHAGDGGRGRCARPGPRARRGGRSAGRYPSAVDPLGRAACGHP